MQIDRISELDLCTDDTVQIADLLEVSFGTDFGGRSFFQQRHHLRLLHRDAGRIVGHMALGLRAIRLGETLCDCLTLADVATHPDHRGKGIASALLRESVEVARHSPADFYLLFGDAPLYAAHGFAPKPNRLRFLDLTGARSHQVEESGPDGLMVMPLGDLAWSDTAVIDLMGNKF